MKTVICLKNPNAKFTMTVEKIPVTIAFVGGKAVVEDIIAEILVKNNHEIKLQSEEENNPQQNSSIKKSETQNSTDDEQSAEKESEDSSKSEAPEKEEPLEEPAGSQSTGLTGNGQSKNKKVSKKQRRK